MAEIMFLMGMIFGVGCGLLGSKVERVRSAHFEAEMVKAQNRARHYQKLYRDYRSMYYKAEGRRAR